QEAARDAQTRRLGSRGSLRDIERLPEQTFASVISSLAQERALAKYLADQTRKSPDKKDPSRSDLNAGPADEHLDLHCRKAGQLVLHQISVGDRRALDHRHS